MVPEARRARAYAIVYWAINLGAAVGPALGGWIASRSWTGLFVLEGATLLGYAAVVLVAVPESRPPAASANAPGTPAPLPSSRSPRRALSLGPVLRDGALAALAVAVLLVGVGFVQLFSVLPLVMDAAGLSELDYGLVVAVNGGLIVLVGLPVAAFVGERLTSWWVPGAVAAVAAGLALTAGADSLTTYALVAVVWTLGEMAFLPVVPTVVAGLAPERLRGSYQGVYHAAWGMSKMLGPALGGFVLAGAGSVALWLGAGALAGVAAVVLAALRPTLRRRLGATSGLTA